MEFKGSRVRVILGIGNPGEEYEHTYHNAGLLFVQFLFRSVPKGSFKEYEGANVSLYTRPRAFSLALSRVYMNQSGGAAREALRLAKASPEELTLVHDDTDIPLGSYKFAFGRGSAGHHGVQSVASSLRTKDFWRLRIGVRGAPKVKAEDIVLRRMPRIKEHVLRDTFLSIARFLES